MLGRYAFSLPDKIARGELRPLRKPGSDRRGRLKEALPSSPPTTADPQRMKNDRLFRYPTSGIPIFFSVILFRCYSDPNLFY
jgi:hypothetical protein